MFCLQMCKDINQKNTKPKNLVSKARFMFQNTQKKCLKTLENLERFLKLRKTIVADKKYGETGANYLTM